MNFDQMQADKRILELEKMNHLLRRQVQENKVSNQLIRVARKNWEKTVDAIDDWICIIDLDSTILRSNRTVEKYFQLKVQEVIGLKLPVSPACFPKC